MQVQSNGADAFSPREDDAPTAERARPHAGEAGESGDAAESATSSSLPTKLTPMMRQYFAVKSEHPNAIVLFRMGDFFETFHDDAVEAARLLDLTLTARSKEKDPVPMAGVPHHAVESYVSRLVELGKTVVLVDQVEDPKLARGLVRREVTDILSPGTFLDPNAPPRLPTYLVALAAAPPARGRAKDGWGLAALDLSTGEFRATAGDEEEVLFDELGRVGMREVLLAESARSTPRSERLARELPKAALTYLPDEHFSARVTGDALLRTFGAPELAGLGQVLSPEALAAAGAALAYVEKVQPRRGARDERPPVFFHLRELRPYVPGASLVLDVEARNHLELFRAASDGGRRGTLLGAIDEAVTAMGGRAVARMLAYPLRDVPAIAARQDAVAALKDAPSVRDRLRQALRGVADLERLVGRVVLHRATPRDLGALGASIRAAPEILALVRTASASPREPELALPEGPVVRSETLARLGATDALEDLAGMLANALVDEPPVDLEEDVFRPGFDPELDRLSALARNGKGLIAEMEAEERARTGIQSLKVRYNRVFGYYIEVTRANLKLVPAHYIRKQTTANGERFYTEALRAVESEVLTADADRLARTRALFTDLVDRVAAEASRLLGLAHALAELDALAGFAHVADQRGWVRPVVDDGDLIEIADGRHPVLELLSEGLGERFVPNDLSIGGERSLMIITGPNMAGKSTIMRQTALIVILAHMGLYVPARLARIGLVDRVFTRVGASDDLSRGRSTFMVEMNETARILRSATARSLILLDEIGRGTSTFDGLSIAWAVAEHLHDHVRARTLFATHYHELTEICRERLRAVNHHVAVKEWNEQIVFLRKLLAGPTNRSYGVQVARLAGLPSTVVERARDVLAALEAQALCAGDGSSVGKRVEATGGGGAPLPAPRRDVRQLFLFGAPPEAPPPPRLEERRWTKLAAALEGIHIDDITPRQALDELARLKAILKEG